MWLIFECKFLCVDSWLVKLVFQRNLIMSIRALKKCRRWSDQDALCQREHWQRISLSTKSSQVLDGSSNESDSYTAIRHRRGPKIRKKVSRPSLACHSLCVTWGQRSTNSDSLNGRRYFGDFVERMAVVKFETNLTIECFSRHLLPRC